MLALEAIHLGKTFRPLWSRYGHRALHDINLRIPVGARVALLGANGSGKTTLLKIFATLIEPTEGWARLMGYDTTRRALAARRTISFVAGDGRGLYPNLTAHQNAVFFAALHGMGQRRAERRLEELMESWDLLALVDRPIQQLSTGERQRLALALSLIPDPDVLLLDEPTRSLDPLAAKRLWDLLPAERPRTVLWSSHAPEESVRHADQMLVLSHGRMVAFGPPAAVAPFGLASLAEWYQA